MKRLVTGMVTFVIALAFVASPVLAFRCPLLISQANDAMAKLKADDPKLKQARELVASAQRLHDRGQHAEAVKKADEALALLGAKKGESKPPARRGYSY